MDRVGLVAILLAVLLLGLSIFFSVTSKVPDSCEKFTQDSDQLIGLAVEGLDLSGKAIEQVSQFDIDGMNDTSNRMKELAGRITIERTEYDITRADCLAGK